MKFRVPFGRSSPTPRRMASRSRGRSAASRKPASGGGQLFHSSASPPLILGLSDARIASTPPSSSAWDRSVPTALPVRSSSSWRRAATETDAGESGRFAEAPSEPGKSSKHLEESNIQGERRFARATAQLRSLTRSRHQASPGMGSLQACTVSAFKRSMRMTTVAPAQLDISGHMVRAFRKISARIRKAPRGSRSPAFCKKAGP
mmetsp:Transcript_18252/g.36734  ORF Transcript_18252/g.36734 Transcript_18252/m.36734 type:complete len:204 (+) Transcript_18252:26-637(+)